MKRRTVLVWRWTLASIASVGLAWAGAAWLAREDTRAVLAGDRSTAGLTDELARSLPADCPRLSFREVGADLGLPAQFRGARTRLMPEDTGGGIALCDLDGDGDADLLLVGTGSMPDGGPSYLLRNDTPAGGALAFTDVTDVNGGAGLPSLSSPLVGKGVAVADVDADGDLDVLITHFRGVRLLRNDGELRFTDVTDSAGFADTPGWCSGAAFGDADGDGDLDLYVCRYVDFEPVAGLEENLQYGAMIPYTLNPSSFRPQTNLFFRNDGTGVFEGGEQAAKELGIEDRRGRSLGVIWADLDQDGMPDLYVANDVSDNVLFRGRTDADGNRGFEDRSHATATADYRGAMGLAVADADADGDDEIFVTHWTAQENGFYRNLLHDARGPGGALVFMDEADRVGLGAVALDFVGWATDFVDLDLDGRADLFVANGATLEVADDRSKLRAERPLLFWNGGEEGYFDVRDAWGEAMLRPRVLRGGAAADLDGDHDLDIVMGALDGPPAVFVNDGPVSGRALAVRLRSGGPNTFGVGARVTVTCGALTLSREMRSSPAYLSAGPLVLHFGLGGVGGPATVHVRWPDGEESEQTVAPELSDVLVRRQ